MPWSVALAGLMGVGKSTVGPLLAARLGVDFVDLDQRIESEAGCSVAQIFAAEGEQGFRRRESAALDRVLSGGGPLVLALGGGTAHQPGAAARIQAVLPIAVLWAPLAELQRRTQGGGSRPLSGRLEQLAQARAAELDQLGPRFSTLGAAPETVAAAIHGWLEARHERS